MLEPAPGIGWTNKVGEFRYPAYVEGLPEIKMTFWPGGFRATGPKQVS